MACEHQWSQNIKIRTRHVNVSRYALSRRELTAAKVCGRCGALDYICLDWDSPVSQNRFWAWLAAQ